MSALFRDTPAPPPIASGLSLPQVNGCTLDASYGRPTPHALHPDDAQNRAIALAYARISDGGSIHQAAAQAGVDPAQLRQWVRADLRRYRGIGHRWVQRQIVEAL